MKKKLLALIRGEEGASLVEYGLLVGLIAVVCITAITALGLGISGMFQAIADKV
jgi:pilus assembly protein Flp/PilA